MRALVESKGLQLTSDKADMVVSIVHNPVTLIRGRAGAGKTVVTVTAALFAAHRYHVRILIAAASNAACDNVTRRMDLLIEDFWELGLVSVLGESRGALSTVRAACRWFDTVRRAIGIFFQMTFVLCQCIRYVLTLN